MIIQLKLFLYPNPIPDHQSSFLPAWFPIKIPILKIWAIFSFIKSIDRKSTVLDQLLKELHITHSHWADDLNENLIFTSFQEVVIDLLAEAMAKESTGFLVDGFPATIEQVQESVF